MEYIIGVWNWCVANQTLLYLLFVLLLAGLRLTKWGRANAAALNTVAGAVEEARAGGVKALVAKQASGLDPQIQRAIADAVNTVDPHKPTPARWQVLVRELLPGCWGK